MPKPKACKGTQKPAEEPDLLDSWRLDSTDNQGQWINRDTGVAATDAEKEILDREVAWRYRAYLPLPSDIQEAIVAQARQQEIAATLDEDKMWYYDTYLKGSDFWTIEEAALLLITSHTGSFIRIGLALHALTDFVKTLPKDDMEMKRLCQDIEVAVANPPDKPQLRSVNMSGGAHGLQECDFLPWALASGKHLPAALSKKAAEYEKAKQGSSREFVDT